MAKYKSSKSKKRGSAVVVGLILAFVVGSLYLAVTRGHGPLGYLGYKAGINAVVTCPSGVTSCIDHVDSTTAGGQVGSNGQQRPNPTKAPAKKSNNNDNSPATPSCTKGKKQCIVDSKNQDILQTCNGKTWDQTAICQFGCNTATLTCDPAPAGYNTEYVPPNLGLTKENSNSGSSGSSTSSNSSSCGGGNVPVQNGQWAATGYAKGDGRECVQCVNGTYKNSSLCSVVVEQDPKNVILPTNAGEVYTGKNKVANTCYTASGGIPTGKTNSDGDYCFNGTFYKDGDPNLNAASGVFCGDKNLYFDLYTAKCTATNLDLPDVVKIPDKPKVSCGSPLVANAKGDACVPDSGAPNLLKSRLDAAESYCNKQTDKLYDRSTGLCNNISTDAEKAQKILKLYADCMTLKISNERSTNANYKVSCDKETGKTTITSTPPIKSKNLVDDYAQNKSDCKYAEKAAYGPDPLNKSKYVWACPNESGQLPSLAKSTSLTGAKVNPSGKVDDYANDKSQCKYPDKAKYGPDPLNKSKYVWACPNESGQFPALGNSTPTTTTANTSINQSANAKGLVDDYASDKSQCKYPDKAKYGPDPLNKAKYIWACPTENGFLPYLGGSTTLNTTKLNKSGKVDDYAQNKSDCKYPESAAFGPNPLDKSKYVWACPNDYGQLPSLGNYTSDTTTKSTDVVKPNLIPTDNSIQSGSGFAAGTPLADGSKCKYSNPIKVGNTYICTDQNGKVPSSDSSLIKDVVKTRYFCADNKSQDIVSGTTTVCGSFGCGSNGQCNQPSTSSDSTNTPTTTDVEKASNGKAVATGLGATIICAGGVVVAAGTGGLLAPPVIAGCLLLGIGSGGLSKAIDVNKAQSTQVNTSTKKTAGDSCTWDDECPNKDCRYNQLISGQPFKSCYNSADTCTTGEGKCEGNTHYTCLKGRWSFASSRDCSRDNKSCSNAGCI